jgi:hypothetical protein
MGLSFNVQQQQREMAAHHVREQQQQDDGTIYPLYHNSIFIIDFDCVHQIPTPINEDSCVPP